LELKYWYSSSGLENRLNVKRILLVTDDFAMTDELTFFLQHSGFQVATAIENREVIAEMERGYPDLIVIHENNHKLNGDDLCIRMRELYDVPIIILGQEQEEAAGVEFLEMGAEAYLPSPLSLRELLARVRSLLRRARPLAEHEIE
jgi:DNA-binding response OmpR family regulator